MGDLSLLEKEVINHLGLALSVEFDILLEKKLRKFANNLYRDGKISKEHLFQSLLAKRLAFKREGEIRLLYFDLKKKADGELFSYEINRHELID